MKALLVHRVCWSNAQPGPIMSTLDDMYLANRRGNGETRGVVRRRHGNEPPYKERVGGSSPSTPSKANLSRVVLATSVRWLSIFSQWQGR